MTEPPPSVGELSGEQLRAVANLWKRNAREVTARFSGSSMQPTIPPGVEVIVRCGAAAGRNDIVAFIQDDRLVVHRVVTLSEDQGWILTRGDAWAIPDPPITDRACILGVVIRVRRHDGFVDPEEAPKSPGRRLGLAVCLTALRIGPAAGRRFIRALTLLHRWLVGVPRGYAGGIKRRLSRPRQRGARPTIS